MSILLRTDVTSVKFYENVILAGIGGSVNVFEKNSSKLIQRIHCLKGQKIYGIVPSKHSQKILVFGGKQFTVLQLDENSQFIMLFGPIISDDWLHSGIWINEKSIALLTAHNVVQYWDISSQTQTLQQTSKDNSILYSGLLLSLQEEVLVMAGTVFSEVIVHVSGEDKPLHRLVGHKGVIFSISCSLQKGLIVTTSDDRSLRIWGPNITLSYPCDKIEYWRNTDMICKYELYGHTARVMRNCLTNNKIISVGEDSGLCFWNYDGTLAKKVLSHQNGCIWSVDADEEMVVSGGGDCAVITYPLSVSTEYCTNDMFNLDIETPKKVAFTARQNIIILSEDDFIFYNVEENSKTPYKLNHESTYKLLSISCCKQMVAVADMNGKLDVFAETCKDSASLINIIDTKLSIGKILSMQWAGNRYLVICLDNGEVKVLASKESNSVTFTDFILPPCKERWLTAAAVDSTKNIFILGDRCGNIHIYMKGQRNPIKTFSKVHGRYGPTSISIRNNNIITTGRDGTIKNFSLNKDKVSLLSSKDLEFKWVEKFLDKDDNIICGFQERDFVVYNIKSNTKIIEIQCGGGHRSWDALRYIKNVNNDYKEFIDMIYLKNSDVNRIKFQLDKIVPNIIVNGSHSKEINCLKIYQNESIIYYISGGEDTTVRISSTNSELVFEDQIIFKQLSSIRALKTYAVDEDRILLISVGGRAQICIKIISFLKINNSWKIQSQELIDYMIRGTDKMRKGNQNWRNCSVDFDPETRVMDVDIIKKAEGVFKIFAGCSDASLRIFTLNYINDKATLSLSNELKYHRTCILKTSCIKFENKHILVTCTTRGEVAFWDVTDINKDNFDPFYVIRTNKSGINSFAFKKLNNNKLLISTAGDDNAMHLVLLQINDQYNMSSIKLLDSKIIDNYHSSEITGLCLIDNFILSTSIDQRITLFEWSEQNCNIECNFLSQCYSDVADIQGMDLINNSCSSLKVCVFGKGIEVLEIKTSAE